ncbi:hypothetical protein E1200_03350 [Actinomadura sp. GC306]|uniref:hypothetical protein n=1 Tax=Actinomadura sp. GC306 TaxID=2530367 RepID=UPI0010502EE5|nr:hypothetical protein [Actinomadura sp. GC306]TDC71041.1 hypothetical protein E1200_03350 [Actinomadura sp. GC306]
MAGPYTRRVLSLACAAVVSCTALTACGNSETSGPPPPSPSPTASRSAPTDPSGERLALRWRKTGGIAGIGGPGSVPEFSLYSSGRAIFAAEQPGGTPPDKELTEYRLKPQALRRLLDGARAAGFDRSHTVGSDQIADAVVTVVTMGDATTRIIEPGWPGSGEGMFLKRLDPEGWPADDQAAPPRPYTPERTAVLAGELTQGGTARPWPLGPLGDGVRAAGGICTLAPSAKLPETRPATKWSSEGETYSVRLRPLLPAERSCEDLA